MRRLRRLVAAVAVLAVAVPLAACGEDDPFESYCEVVGEEQPGLTEALTADDGTAGLLPALPAFERLEDAAPTDIADDWSVVTTRLQDLADALEDAGADPTTYDPVDPPDGITDDERDAISLAAMAVASEAMLEALGNVQQQARDVCGTELTLS